MHPVSEERPDQRFACGRPLQSYLSRGSAQWLFRACAAIVVAGLCASIGRAAEPDAKELRELFRSASNPYHYKSKVCCLKPDYETLERLKASSDPRIRDMAQQR